MKGGSLLFMVFSWMVVVGFVVFCFTVILREGERKKERIEKDFDLEEKEIT